jgi:hypothetical protein
MELISCYLHYARTIHINTDRKQLKQVLHFRFSFEPRLSKVDKSLFLAPTLRTTSCNVHYSGTILYITPGRILTARTSFCGTSNTTEELNRIKIKTDKRCLNCI